MKTVIAEKPSVAREIAHLLGVSEKKDGYLTGNGYHVTWAFGHLVGLAMPEDYGLQGFRKENLPILPNPFELTLRKVKKEKQYNADSGAVKQLKIIEQLFNRCESIIVATDAGREGELIFRYIYEYLKCDKPFERLWISSLTEQRARAQAYIEVRDVYLKLYKKEAEEQAEQHEERRKLNELYHAFVKRYGHLNRADNIKLIKTDSTGNKIPYLERVVGGVIHKADIFHHPVSFSTTELAAGNPDEALSASLNRYGTVDLEFMSQSRTYDGISLLKHALVNTTPNITKKITVGDKEVKVRDMEAIQMANTKIDEIRTAFNDWLHAQNDDFKKRLTDRYNDTFNCFVRPQYDGSHQEFPGLDRKALGIEDLHASQKDAVWMLKLNGGGICDHEVGTGKTLIMCAGAQEMKRLGLTHKPMIIGLKANVHEIAETYRKAYPHAKILYPGKNDFTPKKRLRIFGDIKNNDWDCIILTHDQFGMIPQSPEMQREILEAELQNVEDNLNALEAQGKEISRGMLKGVIVRKQNLEVKLKTLEHDIQNRKDDVVDFKMIGIDHLFVDESHKFKNLMFNTRHDRVAGLGNMQGSKKALNLLFAIRTIQQRTRKDLGATFLSGTTISNSLTVFYD